ncbi:MAG: CAP domain-containing protein [Brevundimonas sp.]
MFAALVSGGGSAGDLTPVDAQASPRPLDADLPARIMAEVNEARTDPAGYARKARRLRSLMRGDRIERPGEIAVVTEEGVAAVNEAIAFLERQSPLAALQASAPIERAASDHAWDQARTGAVGHTGSDGSRPSDRLRRDGRWSGTGEVIAYGSERAEDVVLQLIIDDGVPGRGHRRILFSPAYSLIGAACAPHPVWRQVCVLDLARDR